MTPQFPFSAVVGQDEVKLALLLAAVDRAISGVLLRGEKGSAKTTLARGLASLLPGQAPFVELPIGATEDRLVGTLDLAAALTGGERRFEPGLLAAADGGVLYVDEVNLLPDHLVDVLLDVAASGVNRVEREGVSHTHRSRFVLIGSMNPEEGDLRPQLLDRFGLAVDVAAPRDPDVRAEAVRRRLAFDADPAAFGARWATEQTEMAQRLAAVAPAELPEELIEQVSWLCAGVDAQGLRADLTICRAAAALAGLESRPVASADDVKRVAMLALAHRRRRGPLDVGGMTAEELEQALGDVGGDRGRQGGQAGTTAEAPRPLAAGRVAQPPTGTSAAGRAGQPPAGTSAAGRVAQPPTGTSAAGRVAQPPAGTSGACESVAPAAPPTPVLHLAAPSGRAALTAPEAGRRSTIDGPRGHLVADRPPDGPIRSLAVGATARASAARRAAGGAGSPTGTAPALVAADLREAVRQQRTGNLVVIAVDASGSMGAQQRMEAAKGAVLSLLLDAYQRRDKVAMVTFRGDEAAVALKPTSSVEVARARLADLPTGGRTPLAEGIRAALEVSAQAGQGERLPLLVFITDGRATAGGGPSGDPVAAARDAALVVRRRKVSAVVVDAEDGPTRLGLARDLAEIMGARYLTLGHLAPGALIGSG